MDKDQLEALIIKAAEVFRLDANLVRAICMVESSNNPNATRFEKHWRYFFNVRAYSEKLQIPYEEEEKNQATSFGLMQCMGAVARELGFTDKLDMLLVPDIGIYYGCKKLKKLFESSMCNGEEEKVVSSYNQGSPRKTPGGMFQNQRYVDKVYKELRKLRTLK